MYTVYKGDIFDIWKNYFGDRVPLTDLHDKHKEYVNTLDDVIIIEVKNLNELEKNAEELLSKLRQRIYI